MKKLFFAAVAALAFTACAQKDACWEVTYQLKDNATFTQFIWGTKANIHSGDEAQGFYKDIVSSSEKQVAAQDAASCAKLNYPEGLE